jgi:hypothetical protein
MTVSPETLLAFIDGELSPGEARRVAAEVANDPTLAAHTEKHRALKARLQAVSLPVREGAQANAEAVIARPPEGLGASVKSPPERALPARKVAGMSWIPAAAVAIGIALGLLLAISFQTATEMRALDGKATAQGALARVLSTQLLSEQQQAGGTRIGESFFNNDGFFCRNFTMSDETGNVLSGIACREGEDWRIRSLAAAAPADSGKTPDVPASVRASFNSMIVGKPLDAEAERAARAQGWLAK